MKEVKHAMATGTYVNFNASVERESTLAYQRAIPLLDAGQRLRPARQ
jgi:hypothetical protein